MVESEAPRIVVAQIRSSFFLDDKEWLQVSERGLCWPGDGVASEGHGLEKARLEVEQDSQGTGTDGRPSRRWGGSWRACLPPGSVRQWVLQIGEVGTAGLGEQTQKALARV